MLIPLPRSPGDRGYHPAVQSLLWGLPGGTGDVADNAKWQLWTAALWTCSASGWDTNSFLMLHLGAGRENSACPLLASSLWALQPQRLDVRKRRCNLGKDVHVKNGPFPFAPIVLAERRPSIHKTGQHTRCVDLTSHPTDKCLKADKIQLERSLSGLMGNNNQPTFFSVWF